MAVGDAYVFPGFLTPVLTQLFFPKPPTTFLTCFCRGERRKYPGRKSRLNQGLNSQPPGHASDTLTTEPSERVRQGLVYQRSSSRLPCDLDLTKIDLKSIGFIYIPRWMSVPNLVILALFCVKLSSGHPDKVWYTDWRTNWLTWAKQYTPTSLKGA